MTRRVSFHDGGGRRSGCVWRLLPPSHSFGRPSGQNVVPAGLIDVCFGDAHEGHLMTGVGA